MSERHVVEVPAEIVLIMAMLFITILGLMAMLHGYDGNLFTAVIAAIVTISGYLFAKTVTAVKRVE